MTSRMNQRPKMGQATIAAILFWVALWAVIVATWMYDGDGYTVGMPSAVFFLMMLGPLLVGFALGWGKTGLWQGMKWGMISGALYGLANMVAQLVWGGVLQLLGRIPLDTMAEMGGMGFFALEVVEFTLLFTLTGLVLGLVGGLLGATVSRLVHR